MRFRYTEPRLAGDRSLVVRGLGPTPGSVSVIAGEHHPRSCEFTATAFDQWVIPPGSQTGRACGVATPDGCAWYFWENIEPLDEEARAAMAELVIPCG